jgi:DNA-binding transcriptional LysR family regulator
MIDDYDELIHRTLDGELDVSFVVGEPGDERLDHEVLCRDPFVAIARAADTLPESLDAPTLRAHPLIGQHANSCCSLIEHGLIEMGVPIEYVYRSNDNSAVQAMVRAGMGIAVMPWLAIDPDDPDVRVHDLDPPIAPREIGLVTRRGRARTAATNRFIEIAREVAARLHAERAAPSGRQRLARASA